MSSVAGVAPVVSGPRRLIVVGAAVLDVATWVPTFPVRGGDTLATAGVLTPGGAFNVMAAAARQGMPVLFAGRHGVGPAGDAVRAALAAEGIDVLWETDRTADTGFVVTVVQPDGERTFVTSPSALLELGADALATVPVVAGDAVYVSGYGLASGCGADLARWVGALRPGVTVVADPGPLAADLSCSLLDAVMARADWWSCNRREATALTGVDAAAGAGLALLARGSDGPAAPGDWPGSEGSDRPAAPGAAAVGGPEGPDVARAPAAEGLDRSGRGPTRGVVVRDGAAGCVLLRRTSSVPKVDRIAAPHVEVVDTTGAGDTHIGVFVAGLAAGLGPLEAARRATVAAAISVTRRGPATAPGRKELDRVAGDGR